MEQQANRRGDTLEVSIWYNSEKPGEYQDAEKAIYTAFIKTEDTYSVTLSPVRFEVLDIGDDRVPDPPEHFAGTPKLLMGECIVVHIMRITSDGELGFTQDLEEEDLNRLRQMTQRAYLATHRGENVTPLTNEQLDLIIDEVGPETAAKSLQSEMDERILS